MRAKKNRLSSAELVYVQQEGRSYSDPLFTLLSICLDDDRLARVGVLVSRRVSPLATRRNRLRRAYLAVCKTVENRFSCGWLVLFIPKRQSLSVSAQEIHQAVRQAFDRLKLMGEE